MKCTVCGKEISNKEYYKLNKNITYSYIGYCYECEDECRYTGNL